MDERREYYWIVANMQGRLVLIGPKDSADEANSFAYQKIDVPFQVVPLHTRNRATATSRVKAMRLDATGDLSASVSRAMHQAPQDYKKKWWSGDVHSSAKTNSQDAGGTF
jgi:hypothetical protein